MKKKKTKKTPPKSDAPSFEEMLLEFTKILKAEYGIESLVMSFTRPKESSVAVFVHGPSLRCLASASYAAHHVSKLIK